MVSPRQSDAVAGRLRDLVFDGALQPGVRLPNETALAQEFGVSRPTLREALRSLAAQDLIRTAKGAGGGSYVTLPSRLGVSRFLHSSLTLMAGAEDISLDELLEARELLEVPAARLAATRIDAAGLERLREQIPHEPMRLPATEQFAYNQDFHSVVIEASGNTLLSIAAQPIFGVLQRNLARSRLGARFHRLVNDEHVAIAAAIAAGDADAAAAEMQGHLRHIRPYYEQAWRTRR
jgi:GntR family transcriptional repressor for pyruvate dehydrogenase complex